MECRERAVADAHAPHGWANLLSECQTSLPPQDNADRVVAVDSSVDHTKRKRGRPKGTVGSHSFRQQLREAKEVEQNASRAIVTVRPKGRPRTIVAKEADLVTFQGSKDILPEDSIFSNSSMWGTPLQRKIFLFAKQQFLKSDASLDGSENPAQTFLFSGRRPVTTLQALAEGANSDTKDGRQAGRDQVRVAACLRESTSQLWCVLLQYLESLLTSHGYKGLVLMKCRRYDETPYKIRILEPLTNPAAPASSESSVSMIVPATYPTSTQNPPKDRDAQEGVAAKVMQSEFLIGALLWKEP